MAPGGTVSRATDPLGPLTFWDCSKAVACRPGRTLGPPRPAAAHGWWVSCPHVPPLQPGLLQVSALLSAKGVNEGALLLLAFLVSFL